MLLGKILKSVKTEYKNIPVSGISFDSREVKKRNIFFAIHGNKTSGNKFINEAITKGAAVIITNKKVKYYSKKVPIILVLDARKSLAEACSNFYKKKPKNIIAVTGTNGKSSVADFFYQILNFNNIPVASIGTLGIKYKGYSKKNKLTSMDALRLHQNLEKLSENKINHVILEASSHGLKQKRLDNLNINLGIFTNLSHDHLDYHKNMKSYLHSKLYLFRSLLKKNSKIITDTDNKEFEIIKKNTKKKGIKIISIGSNFGDIKILENRYIENKQLVKIEFNSKIFSLGIPLIGFFQVKNLLMAILAATNYGINIEKIFQQIKKIKSVPGRLECVGNLKNNSNIIIDFAHTPEALKQTLIAIKKQFNKKIILVFGCGGERDKKKRFIMGKIAKRYCSKIFVTDDNPRNENPKKIRNEILKGCKNVASSIGNRKEAIKKAIYSMNADEVVLIAGKGHEDTQDLGKKIINFSDKKIVKKIIANKKFLSVKNSEKNLENINFNKASINTKTLKKGDLFFALRGKKTDGHNFARKAIKKGAIKLIISKHVHRVPKSRLIKVKNTLSALNDLAHLKRNNTAAQIIGITGSAGKTTLKNLVGFALKYYGNTYHSPNSYNNRIGVPLSVSNIKTNTKYGVFEIGMDKKGEIDRLSKIVKPEIAVITNIGGAHFKNFKTLKDIAKAKGEIIDNTSRRGFIVLNKDDKFYKFLSNLGKKNKINIISFSYKKKADIFLSKIKRIKKYYRLKVSVKNRIFYFDVKYNFNNFIKNILACISVLSILNLNLSIMKKKFINFKIPVGRGDTKLIKKFNKKIKFIDESYNSNPLSMSSAIKNMISYKRKRNSKKFAFFGDMLELGTKSKKFHKKISFEINRSDIDKVYVYGKNIKETFKNLNKNKKGRIFTNLKEAYDLFSKILHNNDILMVKGSNATGLNEFSRRMKRG